MTNKIKKWSDYNEELAEKSFRRFYDEVIMDSRMTIDKIYKELRERIIDDYDK